MPLPIIPLFLPLLPQVAFRQPSSPICAPLKPRRQSALAPGQGGLSRGRPPPSLVPPFFFLRLFFFFPPPCPRGAPRKEPSRFRSLSFGCLLSSYFSLVSRVTHSALFSCDPLPPSPFPALSPAPLPSVFFPPCFFCFVLTHRLLSFRSLFSC